MKWWKMPKLKNSKETFWIIFKHCGSIVLQCVGNIFVRKICCLFYGQLPEFLALQRTIKRSVNPSYFLMGVNRQESCKNFPTPIFPPVKIARHTCDCWNRHKNALFTQLLCVLLQLHHLSMKLIWENQ